MARQQVMAGMERKDVPKAVLDAAQEYIDEKRALRRLREKVNEKHIATIALMDANKTKPFKLLDEETGEYHTIGTETKTRLTVKKCAADEVDERKPKVIDASAPTDTVNPGLIQQAAASMDANNVAEDGEGDVVVPEKPAAKRTKKPSKGKA